MVKVVHKEVRGRVRLRVIGLKNSEDFKEYLSYNLRGVDFIHDFSINLITGSLLIHYKKEKTLNEVIYQNSGIKMKISMKGKVKYLDLEGEL